MALPELLPHHAHDETAAHRGERSEHVLVRVVPELMALLLVAVLWPATVSLSSSTGGPGPAFVPQVLLAMLALASLVGLGQEVRRSRATRPAPTSVEHPAPTVPGLGTEEEAEETDLRRALLAAALVLGYVAATAVLGWVIASTAFAALFLWLSGHRTPWTLLGVAVVAPQVLAYVFVKVVYIALPTGVGIFDTITVALYRVLGIY